MEAINERPCHDLEHEGDNEDVAFYPPPSLSAGDRDE